MLSIEGGVFWSVYASDKRQVVSVNESTKTEDLRMAWRGLRSTRGDVSSLELGC